MLVLLLDRSSLVMNMEAWVSLLVVDTILYYMHDMLWKFTPVAA